MTDIAKSDAGFLLQGAPERHHAYVRLRGGPPVRRITLTSGTTGWLVTGYAEARQALADPRLTGLTGVVGNRRALSPEVHLGMNTHMLNLDQPDHARLRRLIGGAFTGRRIARLHPVIQQITDELLDAMSGRDEADLIEALALPLPIRVLTELLGLPREDARVFRGWTETLTASEQPTGHLDEAGAEMLRYVRALIEDKRRAPDDGLLSAVVNAGDGEDRLTGHELTSMVFLLLIAGHETTVNLIGNAVLALLEGPAQMGALRDDPGQIPAAVEEVLRYESPVHACLRHARERVRLGEAVIEPGSVIIVSLLAANRDPARFAVPGELRIGRAENPHIAFGYGFHYCLGAPLARLEGAVALRSLFTRFPGLSAAVPAESLRWRVSLVMHGLESLPVRLR